MRIAIIGSGSAGLAAAYWLRKHHEVHIFEAQNRAGGHANTAHIQLPDVVHPVAVDTGFIVYNDLNYPNFVKMMAEIGIRDQHADMSFSVSFGAGKYEYKGDPRGLFAQRRNLLRPSHWVMIREIIRFFKEAPSYLEDPHLRGLTIAQLLEERNFSPVFTERHILPMAAAIWSTPGRRVRDFPAESFIRFFINHGLFDLDVFARPQWRSIAGGSALYVEKLLLPHGENVFLNSPVTGLIRDQGRYRLVLAQHDKNTAARALCATHGYDQIILACHSDEAAQLVKPLSPEIGKTLLDIPYEENCAILHLDTALMPRRKSAWAAWNYYACAQPPRRSQRHGSQPPARVALTYWMNKLQNLETDKPVLVTLNPPDLPPADKILGRYIYAHPQFSREAMIAQSRLPTFQGRNGLWFCGAWCGYGFHEDGFAAGLAVAAALGCPAPWQGQIEQRSPAAENATPNALAEGYAEASYATA